jgi:hypothetical protein
MSKIGMRAVLWASRREAAPLSPVLDRPFLQHVVEQLVDRGVDRICMVLHDGWQEARDLLGDGSRWGIQVSVHMLQDRPKLADFEAFCGGESDLQVLFGDICRLPALPEKGQDLIGGEAAWPSLYFHDERDRSEWTGWARLQSRDLPHFAAAVAGGADWRCAMQSGGLSLKKVFLEGASLSCESAAAILQSNRVALEGGYSGLYWDGVETSPGVRLARGVHLPADAVLQGPCYLGEECWVGGSCQIGPYAVLGKRSVVERGTLVARSVVAEETYLGPRLDVRDSLVRANVIQNTRLGTELRIEERFVASSLRAPLLPRQWWKYALVPVLTGLLLLWRLL